MGLPKERITNDTIDTLVNLVDKTESLKEKFDIRPENFKNKFELLCYLNVLKLITTDENFVLPITGPPNMGKSSSAISMATRMIEILKKKFNADIPDFSIEKDIEYNQISPQEMAIKMNQESRLFRVFDRVLFKKEDLKEFGFPADLIKNPEGTWLYFVNMRDKLRGYKKFEGDVKNVLLKTFIYDIIFLNPIINGSSKEFSDILIKFFGSDIIIQCKESSLTDTDRLIKKTLVSGLEQLNTSFNRAIAKKVKLSMLNSNNHYTDYNFSEVVDIYPLLIINKKPDFFSYDTLKNKYPFLNKLNFFPVIITYHELEYVLNELDTPTDFFRYLKEREKALKTGKILFKDEIQLFSFYLINKKSFELEILSELEKPIKLENTQQIYQQDKLYLLYLKKREDDKVSYEIDEFIKHMYLSDQPNYLEIAKELSKLDRNDRRFLAQQASKKRDQSVNEKRDSWRMVQLTNKADICFVFYFTNQTEKDTANFLFNLCATAQYRTSAKKVLGLAQTTSSDMYLPFNVALILSRIEPYTPEEEQVIKEEADKYWSKDLTPSVQVEFY